MKILITGATGYIGKQLVLLLKTNNDIELVLTANENTDSVINFDLFKINSEINLYKYFGEPDILIHLAWAGLPDYENVIHLSQTEHHIEFIKNLVVNGLKKVIVIGTCLEYGLQEGCLSENTIAKPIINYAIGKNNLRLEIEKLQTIYGFDFNWIRLFYLFGYSSESKSLFSQLDRAIEEKANIFNMSLGEQQRDYLPLATAVEYMVKIAVQKNYNGIVNCCSGVPVKIIELVKKHLEKREYDIKLNLGYYNYPLYEPFSFWGDNSLLKSIINAN